MSLFCLKSLNCFPNHLAQKLKSLQLPIKPYPSPLFWASSSVLSPLFILLQTHRLLCYSSNISKMLPLQCLCMFLLFVLKSSSSRNHSLSAFRSLIKCHLLNEILPDHAILSAILDPTPCYLNPPALLWLPFIALFTIWHSFLFICLLSVSTFGIKIMRGSVFVGFGNQYFF